MQSRFAAHTPLRSVCMVNLAFANFTRCDGLYCSLSAFACARGALLGSRRAPNAGLGRVDAVLGALELSPTRTWRVARGAKRGLRRWRLRRPILLRKIVLRPAWKGRPSPHKSAAKISAAYRIQEVRGSSIWITSFSPSISALIVPPSFSTRSFAIDKPSPVDVLPSSTV